MNQLEIITTLSHEFGTTNYVRGGGGNTSVKNSDTLWVKPSGTTLGGLQPESFVPMSRAKLAALYDLTPPDDAQAREAMVKDLMAKSVVDGHSARPSVEAPLHDSFDATYVVHTHPTQVTGLLASTDGEATCRRMFPDTLWLDYADPGYTLSITCRAAMREYADANGHQPSVVFLRNHGVFVAANTPEEIRSIYGEIMGPLTKAYAKAGVSTTLASVSGPDEKYVESVTKKLRKIMGDAAAHVCAAGPFAFADGPISPDHIVYSGSFPFVGEPDAETLSRFQEKYGRWPRVIATEGGVFGIGATERQAALALEFAEDGALVRQLAEAFGGIRYIDESGWKFIEGWEGEAYRAKVSFGESK